MPFLVQPAPIPPLCQRINGESLTWDPCHDSDSGEVMGIRGFWVVGVVLGYELKSCPSHGFVVEPEGGPQGGARYIYIYIFFFCKYIYIYIYM